MTFLSPSQRITLAALCETLIPTRRDDPIPVGAADVDLAAVLEIGLMRAMDESARGQFALVLSALENGVFNRFAVGIPKPFGAMSQDEREAVLRAWAASDIPQARQFFQGIKRLGLFLFYSVMPEGKPNPAWATIGYGAPPANQAVPSQRPMQPLIIQGDTTLTTDALIIGSGAGGGVMAGELAGAGWEVLVVEKGEYWHDTDFHGRELESTERLYEKSGALTTRDLSMTVLAGSTLGGGTTVNWGASIRTPDEVLHEWARDYGFSAAITADYARGMDAVCARLNVNTNETMLNAQNAALERGCAALGYGVSVIPRNVRGCEDCGFCNFGCAFGAKQGTLKTYLQDAYDRGGRMLVGARCERILIERGRAVGAILTVRNADGSTHTVTVRSKIVVAAAGALHTPALLLRSGLGNANIGANLRLHPTTAIYGIFKEAIRGWHGSAIGRISAQFADLDGAGYGVRLETAPVHPGIAALTTAWESGAQHKSVMARLAHLANIIILARDRFGGRITVNANGDPILDYSLHPHDAGHLRRGLIEALRVEHAAGADEIASPHARYLAYRNGTDGKWVSFEAYLERVDAEGLRKNGFALFSAHQMGSCRIGGSTRLGAIDPSGESYEARGLYVADGSALPTSTGVNPMISIMSAAHHIAGGIITKGVSGS